MMEADKNPSKDQGSRISRMDPVLIMDDILEKLHLLDYKSKFCAKYGRKPISRTYFAISSPSEPIESKVRYFVELSYWLISLSFEELPGKSSDNKYVILS